MALNLVINVAIAEKLSANQSNEADVTKQTVHIDTDRLSDVAHTGVRRAVLFMGLGLNAAHRDDFRDYELCKLKVAPGQTSLPIDFFPSDLPVERVAEFKQQFATWITGCGMRELLEAYALALDHIHKYALLVLQKAAKLGAGDPQKVHKDFTRRGIPEKLKRLAVHSISPTMRDSISNLYEARNCLTHDLGVVKPERCGADGKLRLSWRCLDMLAKGDVTGAEQPVVEILGKQLDEDMTLLARVVTREREFAVGARLVLAQQDLWEICFFFKQYAIPSLITSFQSFMVLHGVPIVKKSA